MVRLFLEKPCPSLSVSIITQCHSFFTQIMCVETDDCSILRKCAATNYEGISYAKDWELFTCFTFLLRKQIHGDQAWIKSE
jgi:hypothetical protein